MTTEYLLNEELKHVLALLMPTNRLVCEVAIHTGLRVGDVLALRTSQLKPSTTIREAKTGKPKRIGFPEPLLSQLKAQAGTVYVFPSRDSQERHRWRQTVWADIKRASKAFRLPQNVGCHSLRKVYAVELKRKYGSLQRVQKALNHRDDITTLLYAMADVAYCNKYGGSAVVNDVK